MSDQPQQNIDACATIKLAQVRETLDQALVAYGTDPALRRAFIHSIGAIDDRLGRPREWPARRVRRERPR
jgi:hypothetical protein